MRLWLAGAAGVAAVGIGGATYHRQRQGPTPAPEARRRCLTPELLVCSSELCSLPPPGVPGSHVGSPVPRPWAAAVRGRVYHFHDDPLIQEYAKVRLAHQEEEMAAVGKKRVNATFSGLVEDGMSFTELGLDLTLLQHVRHRDSPGAVLQDEDVKVAVDMLVLAKRSPDVQGYDPDARFARHLWESDQPRRRPACALRPDELALAHGPRLARFLADGVVQIASVAEFGVDVAALSAQAADALEHHGYGNAGNGMWTSVHPLPALEPLLHSETLAGLLRGYLGGAVRYDGHYAFKLLEDINLRKYTSGHWHHDRCGRRVRMGILIHDVDLSGRPTEVALGSHNTLYWSQVGHVKMSRIQDAWVRSHYTTAAMTGKAGSAFLLDTNALHRGLLDGVRERSVVFAEFHAHGKIPRMAELASTMPCPSLKKTWPDKPLGWDWKRGKPGYPLFPPDPLPDTEPPADPRLRTERRS